ncbi:unnamed protein product, partial [Rotaria magnacalcarata]
AFDLGGNVFPPAAQLNKTSKYINTFGNGIISNTHANNFNRNNFVGFVPPVNSSLVGRGNLSSSSNSTTPIVNTLVPTVVSAIPQNVPLVINAGGGVPQTPRPPLVDVNRETSTPINVNFPPAHSNISPIINISKNANNTSRHRENIIPSVTGENPIAALNKSLNTLPCLEESGLNIDPFSGFPSLDSSDERTMSRIEALLDNPRGLSYTFEDNIVEPPVQINILPQIVIPELVPNIIASPERVNKSRLPIPVVCVSEFGMAHSDFWSEGRILIAGDSRVRRLMSNPDPTLAEKVDYAFDGGVLINDLVTLVDSNLNDHHKVIILFGMVGDEVQRYIHYVTTESSVNLIRSKECDASEQILLVVKAATAKWIEEKNDRIVLWSIPHYVDYVTFNAGKVGEYDAGESLEISLDSSRRFVNYVTRLKLRWVSECPEVPFCLLNRVLFAGRQSKNLYNSFSAVSAVNYQFPANRLTDGLHPSVQLAKDMWNFLHKSISEVHDKRTGRKLITAPLSSPSSVKKGKDANKTTSFKVQHPKHGKQQSKKPYLPRKIDLSKMQSSVHARLSHPREDNEFEELLEEESLGSFRNLSWKASTSGKSQSTSKMAPLGYVQKSQPWSWSYHNQRINAVKTEVYTQGLESQKRAEGRLADIICDRGLKLAEQGQFDTVNAASRSWLTNLHSEMNAPAPGAKLVQKEMAALLPVEEDKSSSDTD